MALSVLNDIRKIYAGLKTEDIRAASSRAARAGIDAATEDEYRRMEAFLAPPGIDPAVRQQALGSIERVNGSTSQYDFVLCGEGKTLPGNGFPFESVERVALGRLIAAQNEDKELSIARTFPALRKPICDRMIQRVARENALFSMVTALPERDSQPDRVTVDSGRICHRYRVSDHEPGPVGAEHRGGVRPPGGLHGSKGGDRRHRRGSLRLARDRTGARGQNPARGGLIPKAAVAFAGTYVVGLSLEKVNRTGIGLSRLERRDAYADAFEKGKEAVRDLTPQVTPGK